MKDETLKHLCIPSNTSVIHDQFSSIPVQIEKNSMAFLSQRSTCMAKSENEMWAHIFELKKRYRSVYTLYSWKACNYGFEEISTQATDAAYMPWKCWHKFWNDKMLLLGLMADTSQETEVHCGLGQSSTFIFVHVCHWLTRCSKINASTQNWSISSQR